MPNAFIITTKILSNCRPGLITSGNTWYEISWVLEGIFDSFRTVAWFSKLLINGSSNRQYWVSGQLHPKSETFFGTFNVNPLLLVEKLLALLALQETRLTVKARMHFGNYRFFESKTEKWIPKNTPHLGVAVAINKNILNSIATVNPINNRFMTITNC